jgi:hypothetical protein
VPFATTQTREQNAHKLLAEREYKEVVDVLGRDHAILDRIQEMRKDEIIKQEERMDRFLQGRGW